MDREEKETIIKETRKKQKTGRYKETDREVRKGDRESGTERRREIGSKK